MVVQVIFILTGVSLLLVSIFSLAKRKMTESLVLAWAFVAVMLILAGLLLRPRYWNEYISGTALVLFTLMGICILGCAYFFSIKIAELLRKSNELAVQVSLLKHEVERLQGTSGQVPAASAEDIRTGREKKDRE